MAKKRIYPDLITRFWKYVDKTDDCWTWTGYIRSGYGSLISNKKNVSTHRLSWKMHKGEIPEGMMVCHKCDNKRCVNPDHLFLGDAQTNMADCAIKNRRPRKLTQEQLLKVRHELCGKHSQRAIGRMMNISHTTIRRIANNSLYTYWS